LVVAAAVGFRGEISFDASRPDGTPRKLLDVGRLARLGWRAQTSLEDGIQLAYLAYLADSDGRHRSDLLVPDKGPVLRSIGGGCPSLAHSPLT
ncbi:hypothetical protein H8B02_36670, partial [Bradyrhizobium sp. Pear77]|nr:hypothetical protein [Bradyrhizobium altum]